MVRDREIPSEFLTRRVVQQYSVPRGKISVFGTFGGHLGFLRKMKNNYCEYLGKGISSPLMLGGRYTPRQWFCYFCIAFRCNLQNYLNFFHESFYYLQSCNQSIFNKVPLVDLGHCFKTSFGSVSQVSQCYEQL